MVQLVTSGCPFWSVAFWTTQFVYMDCFQLYFLDENQMGVSKNRGGPPKWMVYNGQPYFLMDDLGGKPTIFGNTQMENPFGSSRDRLR